MIRAILKKIKVLFLKYHVCNFIAISFFTNIFLIWKPFVASATQQEAFTSAIIINADNGDYLYSYQENKKIHPASLTKIMTAFIVFDAISNGSIGLHDEVDLRQYYNIGIQNTFPYKGTTTIQELLVKLTVNSCNECAMVLATEVANSASEFVKLMNNKAKDIKMLNTHFMNPHGLYHPQHFSTARDIAILSAEITKQHPELSQIFSITDYISDSEFNTKTTTIQRDNEYIQGSKTGYISESGYNIAIWGEKNNVSIIIVIIGTNSKYSRDIIALGIINKINPNGHIRTIKRTSKKVFSSYLEKISSQLSKNIDNYLINKTDNKLAYTKKSTQHLNRFYTVK